MVRADPAGTKTQTREGGEAASHLTTLNWQFIGASRALAKLV